MGEIHPAYKRCTVCKEVKYRRLEFHKRTANKDGRQNICKACRAIKAKLYSMKPGVAERQEKIQKRYRKLKLVKERTSWEVTIRYRADPKKFREAMRSYRERNPDKIKEYGQRYRKKHAETIREYQRRYREKRKAQKAS